MKRLFALLLLLAAPGASAQYGGTGFVIPVSGSAAGGSATNAQPPSAVLTNLANNTYTGYTNELFWSRTLFVDTNGTDATAVRGDPKKPWLTPGAAISNALSGDTVFIRPGNYPVTPHIVNSNGIGAINIWSRTNITIQGVQGRSIINGSTAVGELFWITNCSGIVIDGVVFQGRVETNFALIGDAYLWAGVSIYALEHLLIERCAFIDHFDHGLIDYAAQIAFDTISTNDITVRNNRFDNIGSYRPGVAGGYDGTAIVPTGWTVEGNIIQNSGRGIVPYDEPEATSRVFYNCVIRDNRIENALLQAISTESSTNAHNLIIEGNIIEWAFGYSRRGSNAEVGAMGIQINGGHNIMVRGNTIRRAPGNAISVYSGNYATAISIIDNTISVVTNSAGGGSAIQAGDSTLATPYKVENLIIERNTISDCQTYGINLLGVRDVLIRNNRLINPISTGGAAAIYLRVFTSLCSNVMVADNWIQDTGSPMMTYGINIDAGCKAITLLNNTIKNPITGLVGNGAPGETVVRWPPKIVTPAMVAGTYTNAEDDTMIILGVGTVRTNKLRIPFRGHEVRVFDGAQLATNIWAVAMSGVINGGPTLTNLSTNYGSSAVFLGDGTNWLIGGSFP